jgi:curved DNA-binding protein CbpA
MLSARDHYAVLGLTRAASGDEIRGAYRKAARATHPDLNPGDASAHERFKRVQLAYEVLGDPHRRAAYDAPVREPDLAAPPRTVTRNGASPRRRQPEPPVSLARELGETFAAIRVVARRSGFSRRVNRLIRYLERL